MIFIPQTSPHFMANRKNSLISNSNGFPKQAPPLHTHAHTHTHTHTHTLPLSLTHTYTHTHTHSLTHLLTHTHTLHTYTRAHWPAAVGASQAYASQHDTLPLRAVRRTSASDSRTMSLLARQSVFLYYYLTYNMMNKRKGKHNAEIQTKKQEWPRYNENKLTERARNHRNNG